MPIVDLNSLKFDDEKQATPTGGQIVDLNTLKFDEPAAPAPPELTMGGQPVPGFLKYGAMPGSQIIKEPGMIGDFGRGLIENLPTAGMVIGGAAGAMGGPTSPLSMPAGGILGAGIGAQARGALKGYLGLGETPPFLEAQKGVGKEMIAAGTAEALGPLLQPVINKIAGPFAKYTAENMAQNTLAKQGQQMVEQGIPISPDVISPSRTTRAADWLLENIWPANSIMASKRRQIYDAATQMKDTFSQEYGVGKTTKDLVNQAWDNWAAMAGGPETVIPMTSTKQAIANALEKPFAKGAFWEKQAKTFAEGDTNVQAIRDLLATVKPAKAMGADKTARRAVLNGLKTDLAAYDEQAGTELAKGLTDAQLQSKALARIEPIERILKNSIDEPKGFDVGLFKPARFVTEWEAIKPRIGGRMSGEDIKMVDAFADKMRTVTPDLGRLSQYDQAGSQLSLGRVLSGGTPLSSPYGMGSAAAAQPLLIFPIGAEGAIAHSLMNPTGIIRNWLTTGLKPPTFATKMGAMKMAEDLQND